MRLTNSNVNFLFILKVVISQVLVHSLELDKPKTRDFHFIQQFYFLSLDGHQKQEYRNVVFVCLIKGFRGLWKRNMQITKASFVPKLKHWVILDRNIFKAHYMNPQLSMLENRPALGVVGDLGFHYEHYSTGL